MMEAVILWTSPFEANNSKPNLKRFPQMARRKLSHRGSTTGITPFRGTTCVEYVQDMWAGLSDTGTGFKIREVACCARQKAN